MALDAHDGLYQKSTLAFIRHCSRVGGNDKLAIDKGGNLPEKVENHCSRPTVPKLYLLSTGSRTILKYFSSLARCDHLFPRPCAEICYHLIKCHIYVVHKRHCVLRQVYDIYKRDINRIRICKYCTSLRRTIRSFVFANTKDIIVRLKVHGLACIPG